MTFFYSEGPTSFSYSKEPKATKNSNFVVTGSLSTVVNAQTLTCIRCPLGCELRVTSDAEGTLVVTGNQCARGKSYAAAEATNPTRTVTSYICVPGVLEPLSVKTSAPVPRAKVQEVAQAIAGLKVKPPISAGQTLCIDIANTGVSVIATKSI